MIDLRCLLCEETIIIPSFIDEDDYDGQLVCQNCTTLYHIKFSQKKLKKYEVKEINFRKTKKVEELLKELKRLE